MTTLRNRVTTLISIASAVAFGAMQSGCLFTSTETIALTLGDLDLAGRSMSKTQVDLTTNATYRDNEHKIKQIDRVGFSTTAVNPDIANGNISLWFSKDATMEAAQEVRAKATPLFENLHVPAGPGFRSPISYRRSTDLIENIELLLKDLETGALTLYMTGDGQFPILFEDFVLIVTFTAGI